MSKIKLLAGVTQNDELYFLEIDPTNDNRNGHPEFSMSGFTVSPLTLETAIDDSYSSIVSLIEEETSKINPLYLRDTDEIATEIVNSDGNLSGIDTSLFSETVDVDGEEWVFRSESCGQHEEENLKAYFIPFQLFTSLMTMWKLYHLKDVSKLNDPQAHELETVIAQAKAQEELQDINADAVKAIEIINKIEAGEY